MENVQQNNGGLDGVLGKEICRLFGKTISWSLEVTYLHGNKRTDTHSETHPKESKKGQLLYS